MGDLSSGTWTGVQLTGHIHLLSAEDYLVSLSCFLVIDEHANETMKLQTVTFSSFVKFILIQFFRLCVLLCTRKYTLSRLFM